MCDELTDASHCAIEGDLRDPAGILGDPELREQIDLREPVAILLTAVLHFIPDEDHPYRLVNVLKASMAPDSHLVISHATGDHLDSDAVQEVHELYAQAAAPAVLRSCPQIARFLDGVELVPPGIVDVACWRTGPLPARPGRTIVLGGEGRKV